MAAGRSGKGANEKAGKQPRLAHTVCSFNLLRPHSIDVGRSILWKLQYLNQRRDLLVFTHGIKYIPMITNLLQNELEVRLPFLQLE